MSSVAAAPSVDPTTAATRIQRAYSQRAARRATLPQQREYRAKVESMHSDYTHFLMENGDALRACSDAAAPGEAFNIDEPDNLDHLLRMQNAHNYRAELSSQHLKVNLKVFTMREPEKVGISEDDYHRRERFPLVQGCACLATLFKDRNFAAKNGEFIRTHGKSFIDIFEFGRRTQDATPAFYLGRSDFGKPHTPYNYRMALCVESHLEDWQEDSVSHALKKGVGIDWSLPKDLYPLLIHYHSSNRPIYFFLSKNMSEYCKAEMEILLKHPFLMKNVTFVLGTDYILSKKPPLHEFCEVVLQKPGIKYRQNVASAEDYILRIATGLRQDSSYDFSGWVEGIKEDSYTPEEQAYLQNILIEQKMPQAGIDAVLAAIGLRVERGPDTDATAMSAEAIDGGATKLGGSGG